MLVSCLLGGQMGQRRRSMEDEMERMRKEVQEKGRQAEEERAALVLRVKHFEEESCVLRRRAGCAEDRSHELALRIAELEQSSGQQGEAAGARAEVERARQREEEAEHERRRLEREVGLLQQSLVDTSQVYRDLYISGASS